MDKKIRKFLVSLCMAAMLTLGIGSAAVAQTEEPAPAEGNESDGDKTGLFGLLGLAGLAGLAKRPNDRNRDVR